MSKQTPPIFCMIPGCTRGMLARGLCTPCHRAALRAIKAGADETAMVDAGLILPKKTQRGRTSVWSEAAKKAGVV